MLNGLMLAAAYAVLACVCKSCCCTVTDVAADVLPVGGLLVDCWPLGAGLSTQMLDWLPVALLALL